MPGAAPRAKVAVNPAITIAQLESELAKERALRETEASESGAMLMRLAREETERRRLELELEELRRKLREAPAPSGPLRGAPATAFASPGRSDEEKRKSDRVLQSMTAERDALAATLAAHTREMEALRGRVDAAEAAARDAESLRTRLADATERALRDANEHTAARTAFEAELTSLRAQLDEARHELQIALDAEEAGRTSMDSDRIARAGLEETITRHAATIQRLEAERDQLAAGLRSATGQRKAIEDARDAATAERDAARTERDAARKATDEQSGKLSMLEGRVRQLEEAAKKAEKDLKNARTLASAREARIVDMRAILESLVDLERRRASETRTLLESALGSGLFESQPPGAASSIPGTQGPTTSKPVPG